MDKTTQIKAQLVGPNALVLVIAMFADHFAKKYNIEIGSDTIMLAAVAVGAWFTSRHVDKTSVRMDVGTVLSGLIFSEQKAIADHAQEIVADPNNPIKTTKDAILATMAQVADVQRRIPEIGIKDALAVAQNANKAEVKD